MGDWTAGAGVSSFIRQSRPLGLLASGVPACDNGAMADEPENLILHYLRRLDAKVDGIDRKVTDLAERISSLERQVAGVRVDFADMRADFVRIEHRLDGFEKRLERIERRLDLHDPAIPG